MLTTAIASSWESWEIEGLDKSSSWKIADLGLSGFVLYYWVHSTVHTHYEQMLLSMVNIVPIHHHVALLVTNLLELYIGNGGGGQLAEGDMLEPSMSCSIANRVYIYICILFFCLTWWTAICHLSYGIGSEKLLQEVTNDFRLTTRGHRFCHASYKSLCRLMCTGRVVKQILKAVERQFPAELDTAVTSWLEVGQSFFF